MIIKKIQTLFFILFVFFVKNVFAQDSGVQYVYDISEKIELNKNYVYCPVIQSTWDQLKEDIVNDSPIQMTFSYPLIDKLNQGLVKKEEILDKDSAAYLVLGYKGEDISKTINIRNKEKFLDIPEYKKKFKDYDAVGYNVFYKKIEFYYNFYDLDEKYNFIGSKGEITKVSGFGIQNYSANEDWKIVGQIKVLNYKDKDHFVVSIETLDKESELILAKIDKRNSFKDLWLECLHYIEKPKGDWFRKGNSIIIPKIDILFEQSFKEFENNAVKNENSEANGWFFSDFILNIYFNMMNEKKEDTKKDNNFFLTQNIHMKNISEKIEKRDFIFNKPFLVVVKKKNSDWPYFMAWIDCLDSLK